MQCLACLKTGKTATVTRVGKQRGKPEGVRVKWNSKWLLLSLQSRVEGEGDLLSGGPRPLGSRGCGTGDVSLGARTRSGYPCVVWLSLTDSHIRVLGGLLTQADHATPYSLP